MSPLARESYSIVLHFVVSELAVREQAGSARRLRDGTEACSRFTDWHPVGGASLARRTHSDSKRSRRPLLQSVQ